MIDQQDRIWPRRDAALEPDRAPWDVPWLSWCAALAAALGCEPDALLPAARALLDGALAGGVLAALALPPERREVAGPILARQLSRGGAAARALALPLLSWGVEEGVLERLLDATQRSADLLADAARCWLDPSAPTALSRPGPVLALALDKPSTRAPLRLALAGDRRAPERALEVHAALGAGLGALKGHWSKALERTRAAWSAAAPALGEELCDGLDRGMAYVTSAASFRCLFAPPRAASWSAASTATDAAAAAAYLDLDPTLRRSHEHQRWGVVGSGPLVSRRFVQGLVLSALHESGRDRSRAIRRLLAELPAEAPRYYDGWRGIPPDLDSLGLFLELSARFDRRAGRGWIPWLRANLRDGLLTTWLPLDPSGRPAVNDPGQRWAGPLCPAVLLIGLAGLVAWDPEGLAPIIHRNTERVVSLAEARALTPFHYGRAYTRLLLHRYTLRYRAMPGAAPGLVSRLEAICRAGCEALAASQRLDGGWAPAGEAHSTPQTSAFCLEALACFGADALAFRCGLRYLSEHQHPDGSWESEDLYVTPAKPPAPETRYRSREVTTALCLRAITAAAARLSAPGDPAT